MSGPESFPRTSIRNKIMMAFILVIVLWGVVLSLTLETFLRDILAGRGLAPETVWSIADRFRFVGTGLTLAGIVLFTLLAVYFARVVTRPVRELAEGVDAIARGDLEVRVSVDSNDEFGHLAASFNRMVDDLREVDRLKSEFITTVSHELRTPLAAILGFSELLLEEDFSPAQKREFLAHIHEKADLLARMVEELLDLSRLERGRDLELGKSFGTLEELVRLALAGFPERSPNHRFEVCLPERPVTLCVDRLKMERVLENILSNAVKYSPAGGVIRVSGRAESDGSLRISVTDQGIGMSPEQLARVFDKFYRANPAEARAGGFGLGMSIVRSIVEAHGGRIWLESEPGRGTTVSFSVPPGRPAIEVTRPAAGSGSPSPDWKVNREEVDSFPDQGAG